MTLGAASGEDCEPTYLVPAALERQRGDGRIHLAVPEHTSTGREGGHSTLQCRAGQGRGEGSLLSLVCLAVKDSHHSVP